ncbi:hypothetical protein EDC01DRAFT_337344 [Geopyxis carbonaria]|nr:hypothetical protein EDC01DRAFT_337344 [Geopyxis carbonaria]
MHPRFRTAPPANTAYPVLCTTTKMSHWRMTHERTPEPNECHWLCGRKFSSNSGEGGKWEHENTKCLLRLELNECKWRCGKTYAARSNWLLYHEQDKCPCRPRRQRPVARSGSGDARQSPPPAPRDVRPDEHPASRQSPPAEPPVPPDELRAGPQQQSSASERQKHATKPLISAEHELVCKHGCGRRFDANASWKRKHEELSCPLRPRNRPSVPQSESNDIQNVPRQRPPPEPRVPSVSDEHGRAGSQLAPWPSVSNLRRPPTPPLVGRNIPCRYCGTQYDRAAPYSRYTHEITVHEAPRFGLISVRRSEIENLVSQPQRKNDDQNPRQTVPAAPRVPPVRDEHLARPRQESSASDSARKRRNDQVTDVPIKTEERGDVHVDKKFRHEKTVRIKREQDCM